jgi:20S proteasome subunit beta 5
MCPCAVYHVTEAGWKKVGGDDVTELHFKYYPQPDLHPANAKPVIA